MTSKFFTWTKGDRKNAVEILTAGGVIPIPVECISIKGMDVRKTPKLGTLATGQDDEIKTSPTSVALHDAAVESATSLVTLINGLLKAPHLSAQISQMTSSLQPPAGRPRSRTAPPTPRHEAPSMEPVELLGSVPPTPLRTQHSTESVPTATSPPPFPHHDQHSVNAYLDMDRSLARMKSTPMLSTSRDSADSGIDMARSESYQATISPNIVSPMKPLLSALQPPPLEKSMFGTNHTQPQPRADEAIVAQNDDLEAVLLSQISSMRLSHDAHIRSLKHAHETEVSSHLAYIAFLERRQLERAMLGGAPLTQDTPHRSIEPSELPGSTTTASPELHSTRREEAKEAVLEVETLRRTLSLIRKEQAEAGDLKHQRDQMRDTLEQRDQRILQLKRATKQARDKERTYRNTIDDLEARLLAANNQRLDALEGFYVACNTLEALSKRRSPAELAQSLAKTVPNADMSAATFKSSHPPTMKRGRGHSRARSEFTVSHDHDTAEPATNDMLQSELIERQADIQALEKQMQELGDQNARDAAQMDTLRNQLQSTQTTLVRTEVDRDRLHALLQAELRRQVRGVAARTQPSPSIAAEAANKVQDMVENAKASIRTSVSTLADGEVKSIPGLLEKELEHCISEIIMYKLDVRGYRKDLKEAKSQIEMLQLAPINRPATPPSVETRPSRRADRSMSAGQHDRDHGGLGILMPYPVTPPRLVPFAPSNTLLGVSPAPSFGSYTPQHRPKTPAACDKRLPDPPSTEVMEHERIQSMVRLLRADAVRSLSEPIVPTSGQNTTPKSCTMPTDDGLPTTMLGERRFSMTVVQNRI